MKDNGKTGIGLGLILILMVATLALPGQAPAQGKSKEPAAAKEGDEVKKEAARKQFKRGVDLFKNEEYSRALEAFLASYNLFPHPKTLVNIASCYERLYDLPRAMEHYTKYLEEAGEDASAAEKAEVQAKISRMADKVGAVEITGGGGGDLVIDGEHVAVFPVAGKLFLSSGTHSVVVKQEGRIIFSENVIVPGGKTTSIDVSAKKVESEVREGEPSPIPVGKKEGRGKGMAKEKRKVKVEHVGKEEEFRGVLHVSSDIEGANVIINGKNVGKSPWEKNLGAGMYEMSVEYEGFPSWQKIVEVEAGKTTTVDVDLRAVKKKPAPYWIGAAGAAVVFAGLWGGFGLAGLAAKQEAEDYGINSDEECSARPGDCDKRNDLADKSYKMLVVADVMGPLALVAAGGSVALFLLVRKEKIVPSAEIRVSSLSPFVAEDGAAWGLAFAGSF